MAANVNLGNCPCLAAIKPEVFLSAQNLTNILKQNASLALLALGMYVVIVTAGIDLSVGSIMGLSMVALAIASKAGVPWPIVLLIGVGAIVLAARRKRATAAPEADELTADEQRALDELDSGKA